MDTETPETGDTSFDLGASIDAVAGSIGLKVNGAEPPPSPESDEPSTPTETEAAVGDTAGTDTPAPTPAADQPAAAPVRAAPKSWAKETHELWTKLEPAVQDQIELREKQILDGLDQYKTEAHFGKAMRDVLSPYKPILAAQGIDEPQAVQYLMNAHYKLTQGGMDQRMEAYRALGKSLGLVKDPPADPNASPLPPELQQLQTKVNSLESTLEARQRADREAVLQRTTDEVTKFASDPAHPHFDELSEDIAKLVSVGYSLNDAYDKAVWANPVTRQQEIARVQTETEKTLREKAKQEADAAKKAASANMRGRDTRRAPTEPKGTMEDTMRETLERIKNRAH